MLLGGLELTFEDDRDEQIEKDERDNKHKADEVKIGVWSTASIDTVSLLLVISL